MLFCVDVPLDMASARFFFISEAKAILSVVVILSISKYWAYADMEKIPIIIDRTIKMDKSFFDFIFSPYNFCISCIAFIRLFFIPYIFC